MTLWAGSAKASGAGVCQPAGAGAGPNPSGEAGWQPGGSSVAAQCSSPCPLASTLPGSAAQGGLDPGPWKPPPLPPCGKAAGSHYPNQRNSHGRTTPGQSLVGTDAKVPNQIVASGHGTDRDGAEGDGGMAERAVGRAFREENHPPISGGFGVCSSRPTPPHPAISWQGQLPHLGAGRGQGSHT